MSIKEQVEQLAKELQQSLNTKLESVASQSLHSAAQQMHALSISPNLSDEDKAYVTAALQEAVILPLLNASVNAAHLMRLPLGNFLLYVGMNWNAIDVLMQGSAREQEVLDTLNGG